MTSRSAGRTTSLASIRARRDQGVKRRKDVREARWRERRLAVPYRTDGPKISLGVIWFGAVIGTAYLSSLLLAGLLVLVAAVAGLHAGNAWAPLIDRRMAAAASGAVAASGLAGALGIGIGMLLAVLAMGTYSAGTVPAVPQPSQAPGRGRPRRYPMPSRSEAIIHKTETLVRSGLPPGLALASLLALTQLHFSAFLGLVLLVSAYEAGDFIVGTGSANAVEGPVAGIAALIMISAGLYLLLPAPFTTDNFPLFVVLTAAAAPLGQIAASAILPRGDSWAPGLRRVDSYLLAAPLWLLLLPRI